jgi:hypothetical protein
MSKLYWWLFDALVYCRLAAFALFVATVLTVGVVHQVRHRQPAATSRARYMPG